VKIYSGAVGQPLDEGTVMITATPTSGAPCMVELTVSVAAATTGDLIVNEFLSDATVNGDPNGDGSSSATDDEFIEFTNASDVTVDLSGAYILEADFHAAQSARHTFPQGTVLRAGEAIVVFGGGDASTLTHANATFQIADNDDPGVQFGLNLNDDGDTIELIASGGATTITTLAYGSADSSVPAGADESTTSSPDEGGASYVVHSAATSSAGDFSPGTKADGTTFSGPDAVYAP
jgi:hypothetical protein